MNRLYHVTIEYLGRRKKHTFWLSTICLCSDGKFLVMDSECKELRFEAVECKVIEIYSQGIILRGYTDTPQHITAYCVYAVDSIPLDGVADDTSSRLPNAGHQARVIPSHERSGSALNGGTK